MNIVIGLMFMLIIVLLLILIDIVRDLQSTIEGRDREIERKRKDHKDWFFEITREE